MVPEARNHIVEAIKNCSKKYKQLKQPFLELGELTDSVDYQYHIEMGAAAPSISDIDGNVVEMSCTLRTFREGTRDRLSDFDEGYNEALVIRDLILDISLLNSKEYIKGIKSSSITPVAVPDSQDIYSYETTFNFILSYGIGD